jgi:hypothetical protein
MSIAVAKVIAAQLSSCICGQYFSYISFILSENISNITTTTTTTTKTNPQQYFLV